MLTGILEGLPAGLCVDLAAVDAQLARRMHGYGRGKRMKIEADAARFVGGLRGGETFGAPVAWLVENRDWVNWHEVMSPEPRPSATGGAVAESGNSPSPADARKVTRPRPGHADLVGGIKYDRADLRDILERASARETAARVVAGALCRQLLETVGVRIGSHVTRIGAAALPDDAEIALDSILAAADDSPVRCVDPIVATAMVVAITAAHDALDTLGGTIEVVAGGVPLGLGSHVQWDRKLEARIGAAMLSIPAIKGVEIGAAARIAALPGSQVHDPIFPGGGPGVPRLGELRRGSNRAGGTEGGMSTGGEIRVRAHMKPLSTLRRPLPSVDLATGAPVDAVVQRSDTCAVPAAAIVGEAMLALVLADALLEKFGGDSTGELRRNVEGFAAQARRYLGGAD